MRGDRRPKAWQAEGISVSHDRIPVGSEMTRGKPRPLRHRKSVQRRERGDESLGLVRQPAALGKQSTRLDRRWRQPRWSGLLFAGCALRYAHTVGHGAADKGACADARFQQPFRDKPADRIERGRARDPDFAGECARRRQSFAAVQTAGQDDVAQPHIELDADLSVRFPVDTDRRQDRPGLGLHVLAPRAVKIGLQALPYWTLS
jgi:hypothetical protein